MNRRVRVVLFGGGSCCGSRVSFWHLLRGNVLLLLFEGFLVGFRRHFMLSGSGLEVGFTWLDSLVGLPNRDGAKLLRSL